MSIETVVAIGEMLSEIDDLKAGYERQTGLLLDEKRRVKQHREEIKRLREWAAEQACESPACAGRCQYCDGFGDAGTPDHWCLCGECDGSGNITEPCGDCVPRQARKALKP
jgi:hypothetical protein